MSGMFRLPVGDPVGVIGSYDKGHGPVCPKCASQETEAVWRDPVWEETGCRCNTCGHDFVKE